MNRTVISLLGLSTCLTLTACFEPGATPRDAGTDTDASEGGDTEPAGETDGSSGSTGASNDDGGDDSTGGQGEIFVGESPTKGGTVAVDEAHTILAAANKGTGDVSIFDLDDAGDITFRTRVLVGDEPTSVAFHPSGTELFVVSRASGTVSRFSDLDTDEPGMSGLVTVGSEPSLGALSPTGRRLYVSNWADGTVSVVGTQNMEIEDVLQVGGAPYAVCVTNDLDEDDDDETIYVTDFYARPGAGAEGDDDARQGRVFAIDAGTGEYEEIVLDALSDVGIPAAPGTGAFPNQLYGCVINGEHLYVTSVGASPEAFEGTTDFRQNIQGLVHAVDLQTHAVDPGRTVNLNALVDELLPPKRFVAIPHDIAFADNSDFGYVVSMASDSLLRVDWEQAPPVAGSPSGATFLASGQSPTGVAIAAKRAYVYNEVGRSVSVIDLAAQETLQQDVESAPQPTDAQEADALLGQRFFNTGLARWSANGWVSCAGCHPFGTTDNVTWVFPAGPRQTVDVSATFDRSGTVQRILNWTAIFDEVHDFELNTRGVANGTGAIVSSGDLNDDGTPNLAARIDFVGPGGPADPINGFNRGSARAVAAAGARPDDWDLIETYIRSLRSPRRATVLDGDPQAGRDVFVEAGCQNCHGGPLWTLSERYYTPVLDGDASAVSLAQAGVASVGDVRADQLGTTDTSAMAVIDTDANGAPHRHSCVVRRVGTFDAQGPQGRGAAEIRQNGGAAQGVDGFNVPSLLGANMGAPYLHNGAAESLDELLSPEFGDHLRAGNQVFTPTEQQRRDLIAFIRTIDDATETIAVPSGQRFCPEGFVPPPLSP